MEEFRVPKKSQIDWEERWPKVGEQPFAFSAKTELVYFETSEAVGWTSQDPPEYERLICDKPAQPGFSPRVEPDYNSDDDVNDIGTLFGYDETAKTRRMGFKKFGWYEGTQRFDPCLLNYAEHGLS